MENPATWNRAESIVEKAYQDWWADRDLGCTGLSLARRVTDALRKADLLQESKGDCE